VHHKGECVLSSCGTANLEAAFLETPLISFYRISPLSYFFGIKLVKIKNYSIVNILVGDRIIPELIQQDFTSGNIYEETKKILDSEKLRSEMKAQFRRIKTILGEKSASQNAARELEILINSRKNGDRKVNRMSSRAKRANLILFLTMNSVFITTD
jgi:lipid-A-disaccharide synthase